MKHHRRRGYVIAGLLALGLTIPGPVSGQIGTSATADEFVRSRIPAELRPHMSALGGRALRRGKERVMLQGEFVDETGHRTTALVTLQLPGRVRLDGMRTDGVPILFDGTQSRSLGIGLTPRDQAVLDAFAVDSVEGLLAQAAAGAAVRLIGRGFGPDPAKPQEAGNPVYDIFDVSGPMPTQPGMPPQSRQYYFDSDTGLLARVFYSENGQVAETRFSGWAELDGDMYPGRIEHFRSGRPAFSFTTQLAGAAPAGDTTIFQVP